MKKIIKKLLLPGGRRVRRLRGGVAHGMLMQLDPRCQFQRYLGLAEREIMNTVAKLASQCISLVDIGASDGYYTLAFLRSSSYRVIACEPGPSHELLLANAAANGFKPDERFHLVQQFVGRGSGKISLAAIVDDLPKPIFVKMDIDGGEIEALRSAENSSALGETCWIVETHSPDLERDCIDWCRDRQYLTLSVPNAWWRRILPEMRPIEQNRWLVAVPELLSESYHSGSRLSHL